MHVQSVQVCQGGWVGWFCKLGSLNMQRNRHNLCMDIYRNNIYGDWGDGYDDDCRESGSDQPMCVSPKTQQMYRGFFSLKSSSLENLG